LELRIGGSLRLMGNQVPSILSSGLTLLPISAKEVQ
jgi:hypothetical protein